MAKNGCKIQKNSKNNKINGVLNQEGEKSSLFQEILNAPTLTLSEAIDSYKNVFSDKFKKEEPIIEILEEEPIIVEELPKMEITITDEDIKQLVKNGEITYTDENNNLCAKNGIRGNNFTKGSKWEIVEDLKGASHSEGGIDLQIGDGGVTFKKQSGSQIIAKEGVLIPFKEKDNFDYSIPFLEDEMLLQTNNPSTVKIAQNKIKKEFEEWKQKNLNP